MQAFQNQGVMFSDQHFSEETIAWLLRSPQEVGVEALPAEPTPVQLTPASAFAAAWAEVSQDEELARALREAGYTQEKGLAEFSRAIAASLSATADIEVSASLKVAYVMKAEDGAFVHILDGERILSIPSHIESAAVVSANAEAVMYAIFLVIDVLTIVMAAIGVRVAAQKKALVKALQTPLQRFLKIFTTSAVAAQLKALEATGKKIELILKILGFLRGNTNLRQVITVFLGSLSWVDKALAVVQLTAAVLLLIATAGASLTVKILQLAVAIGLFIADIVSFVRALGKK